MAGMFFQYKIFIVLYGKSKNTGFLNLISIATNKFEDLIYIMRNSKNL
jgi:hypothetical protein